jgi:polyhydroxyalkanoate synthesis regulator phasin
MSTTVKLTPALIKQLIREESAKLASKNLDSKKAKETEAEDLADTLAAKKDFTVDEAKKISYARALKAEVKKLRARLAKVQEQHQRVIKSLLGE